MAGCNSVIENRKLKEDIAKHANKNVWAAGDGKQNKPKPFPVADSCCSSKTRLTPLTFNKFYGQGDAETRGSYDVDDRKRIDSKSIDHDCCIFHDGCSKDLQHFLTYQMPSKIREPSFGLRRSYSLELRPPYLEDRSWTTGRKKCSMRPSTAPEDGIYEIYRTMEPLRDCSAYRKLIEPVHKQEQERSRPKPSRIPVYSKKHWESGPAKEYVKIPCECGKDSLTNPSNRGWRLEGHAIYCPKAAIAYRCYLNNKLESLFRVISKRQYCGNIIDSSSHARWMRMAGIYQDEDASYFKKFAKNRMVLPISEYKSALQKMCEECNMDYWEVLRRMTNIEIGTSDSNSSSASWRSGR
ncbi:uncharacterized protein TNIN_215591 [Trichonephila inaurata madagascariensis]|uniref:Uncharacterized protein n=1 Tax=Trichonephila inaurata madagascariensis TaxID=2747483 RepID=A0A8X7C1M1_9ARAC|nr:uncharacterized protein TNIN_215591 [Trichonephila inaurata madagascariensis]